MSGRFVVIVTMPIPAEVSVRAGYLVALALFCTADRLAADTGFLDRQIVFSGQSYRYQVYVPAGYDPSNTWPVIVDLHGNGAQGTDGLTPTRFQLGKLVRLYRDSFPTIIIFPQAPPGHFWEELPMQQLVLAELDATEREFRTDANRVYLTGFSMGGLAAYRIAFRWPDRFAALFVVAGRILFPNDSEFRSRFEVDRQANIFPGAQDPYAALAARLFKLPMWIFHGTADDAIDVDQSRRIVGALKTLTADVRYTELPALGHNEAADKAYNLEVFEWLLSQRRGQQAR